MATKRWLVVRQQSTKLGIRDEVLVGMERARVITEPQDNPHPYQPLSGFGEVLTGRLNFLMDSSTILASCLDKNDMFERLAHLIVPFIADWCVLIVVEPRTGRLKRVGTAHVNPDLEEYLKSVVELVPISPESVIGPSLAMRTGKSELLPHLTAESVIEMSGARNDGLLAVFKKAGLRSAMTTPFLAHGELLGAVWYAISESQRVFSSEDVSLAEELSRRSALALYALNRFEAASHARDRLSEVLRLYENFINARSEDLRSPLTAARLRAELLLEHVGDAEKVARSLPKIICDIDSASNASISLANTKVMQDLLHRAHLN